MKNIGARTLIVINQPPEGDTGLTAKLQGDLDSITSELEKWKGFPPSDPFVRDVVSYLSLSVEVHEVLLQHFQNKEVKNES